MVLYLPFLFLLVSLVADSSGLCVCFWFLVIGSLNFSYVRSFACPQCALNTGTGGPCWLKLHGGFLLSAFGLFIFQIRDRSVQPGS